MPVNALFLLVVAGIAMVMDLRVMQVENGWILFSLITGFFLRFWQEGIAGIPGFLIGVMLPAAVLGILFCFRMLGPGDIKLFCALGGIMGVPGILRCMMVSFLIGAVLSFSILISYGIFCRRIHYLIQYFQEFFHTGRIRPYYRKGMCVENFHFTVPVFLSVMLYAGGVY